MLKRIGKWILKICIFILIYLLQIYVVNNTTFFGVIGNLSLMAVAITALIESNINSYITAGISGIVTDVLFSSGTLKYTVIYIIVVAVLIELKKLYKQDSKMAIIIFSILATVICELVMLIFNIVSNGQFVNVFSYIFAVLKESIINICFAYVIYLALNICRQEG